jgi:O-antigen/teichoic acid export membrane protein
MQRLKYFGRGQALFAISALEYITPLARIMLLSRFVDLRELGFCSALLAVYGLFEQITDMAFYRFAMSTPREDFDEALASAHALSLLRGIVVGGLAVLLGPLIAGVFSLSDDRGSFMFLGCLILVRSFENFAPRVAEREFRFSAQLKVGMTAHALGLATLVGALAATHDHRALLASVFVLMASYVATSHFFSESPYRISFRSPQFSKALQFGLPLTINGAGLALSSQADRFLVGTLLGLPELGVYTLTSTAVVLPTNMIWRIAGGINTALFFKAVDSGSHKGHYIALAGYMSAIIGAAYAICVALLLNIVVPALFGPRFAVSPIAVVILTCIAYARIARGEPFGSLLLIEGRTKRLAMVNLSVAAGLAFSAALMFYFPTIECALAARLLGEALGLVSAIYLCRNLFRGSIPDFVLAHFVGSSVVATAGLITWSGWAEASAARSLGALAAYGVIIVIWAGLYVGPTLRMRLTGQATNQV